VTRDKGAQKKSAEDVVREIKMNSRQAPGEDYRERSLAIHGLICARCAREFDASNRHLLTVHHKDGNHHNNPADGSNWENLCVYCHEDVHSRGILGEYMGGAESGKENHIVYTQQVESSVSIGNLGMKLKDVLNKKVKK
jgi:hypothetical protein